MTPAITLKELLAWNQQSSGFWKAWLDANPAALALPCDIDRTANAQGLVRHIWTADLVWARRIAGLQELDREKVPGGPIDLLYGLHLEAVKIFQTMLDDPAIAWEETLTMDFKWMPPEGRVATRRKAMAHALFHGPRHWAQLATLARTAGFPTGFLGDLLFCAALA